MKDEGDLVLHLNGQKGASLMLSSESAAMHQCPQCGASFATQAQLQQHVSTAHPPPAPDERPPTPTL